MCGMYVCAMVFDFSTNFGSGHSIMTWCGGFFVCGGGEGENVFILGFVFCVCCVQCLCVNCVVFQPKRAQIGCRLGLTSLAQIVYA